MKQTILLSLFTLLFIGAFAQVKKPVGKKPVTTAKKSATVIKKTTTFSKNKTAIVLLKKDKSIRVKITTDSGVIVIKLYDNTPLHRDNFVKLVKEGFYDSLLFHRVIPNFMIQGGDPLSKDAPAGMMLGNGGSEHERIPAEFVKGYFHKKGALAAARDGNPAKASSYCQFYIVEGKKYNDEELNQIEMGTGIKFTPAERQAYKTVGGTPFLDHNYTVFGETISGFDVIDKITNASRDAQNRPLGDIRMKMEVMK